MSARFETINKIQIHETNGTENKGVRSDMPKLEVSEHWNRREFIVIELDGVRYTVSADQLRRAIDNAQNAHKL